MQEQISGKVAITPREVKEYFDKVPKDSIPYFSTEVEVGQIVIPAQVNDAAKQAAIAQLNDIRARVLAGESFEALAKQYSQDPGSGANGPAYDTWGELFQRSFGNAPADPPDGIQGWPSSPFAYAANARAAVSAIFTVTQSADAMEAFGYLTKEMVKDQMSALAMLHGHFWGLQDEDARKLMPFATQFSEYVRLARIDLACAAGFEAVSFLSPMVCKQTEKRNRPKMSYRQLFTLGKMRYGQLQSRATKQISR